MTRPRNSLAESFSLYEKAYGNDNTRPSHPVLAYQREASYDTHPANYGDPIRPPANAVGPSSLGFYPSSSRPITGNPSVFLSGMDLQNGNGRSGPYVGKPMGVPIPQGALKETSEKYRRPELGFYETSSGFDFPLEHFEHFSHLDKPRYYPEVEGFYTDSFPSLRKPLSSSDYFKPYGPNDEQNADPSDTPFYRRPHNFQTISPMLEHFPPLKKKSNGINSIKHHTIPNFPFYGSANAFAPFPEVLTPWEKIGIISDDTNTILNLFRRPIAPLQDVFEYSVQNKDGMIIRLDKTFIENGDIIPRIKGYTTKGPWKADIFVNNKYIWV